MRLPRSMTGDWLRVAAGAGCLLIICGCDSRKPPVDGSAMAGPLSFWVWHRSSELDDAEIKMLNEAGVKKLYWQVAECRWEDGAWAFKRVASPMAAAPDIEIIPVFRIEPQTAFLGSPDAAGRFAEMIRRWLGDAPAPDEIQLDFDCPDRLLDRYARFLTGMRKQVAPAGISITALAAWPRHPDFGKLAAAVDSFAPMFYDLEADEAADVRDGQFRPIADPSVAQRIADWAGCPKPWLAGLPNFERLSIFTENGALVGHARGWRHESLFFHPHLERRESELGTTIFEPTAAFDLTGTRVSPGMRLAHRAPDLWVMGELVEDALRAGAAGVVWFALPGPGMRAAFSVSQITDPGESAHTEIHIRDDGRVILLNSGAGDLPPGAWELMIRAEGPGNFRAATPGAFFEITTPGGLPAEMSDTLRLRFARLPAGGSIVSGPLVARRDGLVWRIHGVTGGNP